MGKLKKWTEEEDLFLKENYEKMKPVEIADILNRSKGAVYNRVSILGCQKAKIPIKWNNESFRKYVLDTTNGEYKLLDEYKSCNQKVLMKHLICGNIYPVSPGKFLQNRRCPLCAIKIVHDKQRLSQEEFENRVGEVDNGDFIVIGQYKGNDIAIEIYHKKCNSSFMIQPSNFFIKGNCNVCFKQKVYKKSNDTFLLQVQSIYGDEYTPCEEYIDCRTKILVKHNKCGKEWRISPSNLLRKYGCPYCCSPKGERFCDKFLNENNIEFETQYTFNKCKGVNGGLLKFDFMIIKNDLPYIAIEIQGSQHYQPVEYFGGKEKFRVQQIHDQTKRDYCKDSNIRLIEIPYTHFGSIEKILDKELSG